MEETNSIINIIEQSGQYDHRYDRFPWTTKSVNILLDLYGKY